MVAVPVKVEVGSGVVVLANGLRRDGHGNSLVGSELLGELQTVRRFLAAFSALGSERVFRSTPEEFDSLLLGEGDGRGRIDCDFLIVPESLLSGWIIFVVGENLVGGPGLLDRGQSGDITVVDLVDQVVALFDEAVVVVVLCGGVDVDLNILEVGLTNNLDDC